MTLTLVIGTIAVTSAGAGGRADSSLGPALNGRTGVGVEVFDPPSDQPSQVALSQDGTIAVTSAGAGGHASLSERDGQKQPRNFEIRTATLPLDDRGQLSRSESDPVAYWHRLAVKRLRLLGARERRIVRLLVKLRAGDVHRGHAHGRVSPPASTRSIICSVFGAHCSEALRVAWCESRWNVHATNGDYWGLFQFGSYARARYGFSWTAWGQARAAYRYYLDAGWSPWTCKPG